MIRETHRDRPASSVRIVPPTDARVQGEKEWHIRKDASQITDRKRRNEFLRANGLQPLQPVTISTPDAPAEKPQACIGCGAAVEAWQGLCRYCRMKVGRKN